MKQDNIETETTMGIHNQTTTKRYADYKKNAATRGLVFELTKAEFAAITDAEDAVCVYCGAEDHIGVDRIDSGRGYVAGNTQRCCTFCNKMKSNFGEEAFLAQIARIQRFQEAKGR
jgi:hypothetical protein